MINDGEIPKKKVRKCRECKNVIETKLLDRNYSICPCCGNYFRVHARKRILMTVDKGTFHSWNEKFDNKKGWGLVQTYASECIDKSKRYGLEDAILIGEATINGHSVAIGVMDTRFMMASMGYVVGEKIALLFEKATKKKLPVIIFCCAGGARIQEGLTALFQMNKTAIAVKKHSEKGLLYISVLTNPTMGGVTASFAVLADVILAEKKATIGFAGPRVIEENMGGNITYDIQNAETKLKNGMLDRVINREEVRPVLGELLELHKKKKTLKEEKGCISEKEENREELDVKEKLKIVRSIDRPCSKEYIRLLFDGFVELKGDRISGEDSSIVGGIAFFHGTPVTIIGQDRGRNSLEDAISCNWGMTTPAGYRKVLRLMKQAEKFGRPIICFVDTIGAACDKEAEEMGQEITIANSLKEIASIRVPILSIIIGEAYSGGALVLCSGNEVWMLENALFSVISPEAYESIISKKNTKEKVTKVKSRMSAVELNKRKMVDKVIIEQEPITNDNIELVTDILDCEITRFMCRYQKKSISQIVKEKENKFREI